MPDDLHIRVLRSLSDSEIAGLCGVLIDCVAGGASVGFMWPLSDEKARAFWERVSASATHGERVVLVAEDAMGRIVGTVQVIWAQPENQPHRGDLAKMLVHRCARRKGVGAALLATAERVALEAGRTVLVLDTVTGSDASRLYTRHNWQRCGEIPQYALWPDGRLCATTVYYKLLQSRCSNCTGIITTDPESLPTHQKSLPVHGNVNCGWNGRMG